MLREGNGRVTFTVRVTTRANKNEIAGVIGESVQVRLTAPPVEGKANEALVKFLASMLGIPRSSVEIVAGRSSRNKVIGIRGLCAENIEKAILNQRTEK